VLFDFVVSGLVSSQQAKKLQQTAKIHLFAKFCLDRFILLPPRGKKQNSSIFSTSASCAGATRGRDKIE